jgi:hypothetical protein
MILPHLASRLKPVNAACPEAIASPPLETGSTFSCLGLPHVATNVAAAHNFSANFASALALLQHSPSDRS